MTSNQNRSIYFVLFHEVDYKKHQHTLDIYTLICVNRMLEARQSPVVLVENAGKVPLTALFCKMNKLVCYELDTRLGTYLSKLTSGNTRKEDGNRVLVIPIMAELAEAHFPALEEKGYEVFNQLGEYYKIPSYAAKDCGGPCPLCAKYQVSSGDGKIMCSGCGEIIDVAI